MSVKAPFATTFTYVQKFCTLTFSLKMQKMSLQNFFKNLGLVSSGRKMTDFAENQYLTFWKFELVEK